MFAPALLLTGLLAVGIPGGEHPDAGVTTRLMSVGEAGKLLSTFPDGLTNAQFAAASGASLTRGPDGEHFWFLADGKLQTSGYVDAAGNLRIVCVRVFRKAAK